MHFCVPCDSIVVTILVFITYSNLVRCIHEQETSYRITVIYLPALDPLSTIFFHFQTNVSQMTQAPILSPFRTPNTPAERNWPPPSSNTVPATAVEIILYLSIPPTITFPMINHTFFLFDTFITNIQTEHVTKSSFVINRIFIFQKKVSLKYQ